MEWEKQDQEALRQCMGIIGSLHLKYQKLTGKKQSSSGDVIITSGDIGKPKKEGVLYFNVKFEVLTPSEKKALNDITQ